MGAYRWLRNAAGLTVLAIMMGASTVAAQDRQDAQWRDNCENRSWSRRPQSCAVRVQHLPRQSGPLSVDGGENGAIEISGSAIDDIVVHTRIQARGATVDAARELASQVQTVATGGSLHAEGPASERHGSWNVNYWIEVPNHTDLTLVAENGPVSVDDVSGRLDIRAQNGPVELDRVGGDVHVRAENGPLDVTLAGARWDGKGLDAETQNGPVDLQLPARYAAHLETGTTDGPVDLDFPVTMQGHIDLRRIEQDIGGGGPPVRVVTTNGPVHLRTD